MYLIISMLKNFSSLLYLCNNTTYQARLMKLILHENIKIARKEIWLISFIIDSVLTILMN